MLGMIVLVLVAAGCRQPAAPANPAVKILLETVADTQQVGNTELIIRVLDANEQPIDGAQLAIRGDMAHAGMQPVLRETSTSEEGVYLVPFAWTMGGDWFVEVTATLPDGSTASQRFEFSVATP